MRCGTWSKIGINHFHGHHKQKQKVIVKTQALVQGVGWRRLERVKVLWGVSQQLQQDKQQLTAALAPFDCRLTGKRAAQERLLCLADGKFYDAGAMQQHVAAYASSPVNQAQVAE